MHKSQFISMGLLAAFLLYAGCKGEEKLAFAYTQVNSTGEANGLDIAGEWAVDSLSLFSVSVPSFCYRIEEGATFVFTENDSLYIYPQDALKPCDAYSYTIQNSQFQLIKDDMVMLVAYQFPTNRKLVLNSKTFFRWQENYVTDSLTYRNLLEEGVTVVLSRK